MITSLTSDKREKKNIQLMVIYFATVSLSLLPSTSLRSPVPVPYIIISLPLPLISPITHSHLYMLYRNFFSSGLSLRGW